MTDADGARDALDELRDFFDARPQLEVATVARPKDKDGLPEGRVLNLAADAEAFFRDTVRTQVVDAIPGWSLRKLDPVYKPDKGTVEWATAADVEALAAAVASFSHLSPLAAFRPGDEDYKRRLSYWVCVLSAGARQAFFFRAFTASAELSRKARTALTSRDGTFTKVEEEIFLFEERIDCIVFGDYLYVIRKDPYRRIFEQLEQVRRAARRAAEKLHERVPIANLAAFADACAAQPTMADKIIAVTTRDYFGALTIDLLKPVIAEFKLAIPVTTQDGREQLVFETDPERRWRIVKLVDDDYLKSSMTGHRYEANSKTVPPA
jgi:hypothetical protein